MIKNLLYNCYPAKHSAEWKLNIKELLKYSNVFNGKKIILVKVDTMTERFEDVVNFFDLNDAIFLKFDNDPKLGEVVGFLDGLKLLNNLNAEDITFYAHTKGTKYRSIPAQNMATIRRWRNRMYYECLSDIKNIEDIFSLNYSCCGCFLENYGHLDTQSAWHFSGTFWWVKHSNLFKTNWTDIHNGYYGVEQFLGRIFPIEEAYCLYDNRIDHGTNSLCEYECKKCGHHFVLGPATRVQRWEIHKNPQVICSKCGGRKAEFVKIFESIK